MKEAPKVYLARAGKNGEDEDYALENNLAIIGFQNIPSLGERKELRRRRQACKRRTSRSVTPRHRKHSATTHCLHARDEQR